MRACSEEGMRMRDKTMHVKRSYSDKIFDSVNVAVMIFLLIIFVWSLWVVGIASVSKPKEGWNGDVLLIPQEFTLMAYGELFAYKIIWVG